MSALDTVGSFYLVYIHAVHLEWDYGKSRNALQQLRAEQRVAQLHAEKLGQAISVIESPSGSGSSHQTSQPKANCIGSFTAKNGTGSEGEMGECSEGVAASGRLNP